MTIPPQAINISQTWILGASPGAAQMSLGRRPPGVTPERGHSPQRTPAMGPRTHSRELGPDAARVPQGPRQRTTQRSAHDHTQGLSSMPPRMVNVRPRRSAGARANGQSRPTDISGPESETGRRRRAGRNGTATRRCAADLPAPACLTSAACTLPGGARHDTERASTRPRGEPLNP